MKLIIIGGGAAGMFAAVHASDKGHEVHLFEKNEKLGKKLYITGKEDAILPTPVMWRNFFRQ